VVITRNEQPVAELIRLPAEKPHPVPGRCKGMLTILSEDDEHLKDWAEYMP
jgi:antitoxin (DNA-binding transcriptional repressor) of toxin-antitoxin stability system